MRSLRSERILRRLDLTGQKVSKRESAETCSTLSQKLPATGKYLTVWNCHKEIKTWERRIAYRFIVEG
jgi:hypothetical protein